MITIDFLKITKEALGQSIKISESVTTDFKTIEDAIKYGDQKPTQNSTTTIGYLRRRIADTFNLAQMFIAAFANTLLAAAAVR